MIVTQEDRNLLLADLCARLPYRVKVKSSRRRMDVTLSLDIMTDLYLGCDIKPYLRTMSKMTEEYRREYELLANHCIVTSVGFIHLEAAPLIDWLNAHHFDYRGLIEKGLALEASEGMYKN